jgi:hypothetical protein
MAWGLMGAAAACALALLLYARQPRGPRMLDSTSIARALRGRRVADDGGRVLVQVEEHGAMTLAEVEVCAAELAAARREFERLRSQLQAAQQSIDRRLADCELRIRAADELAAQRLELLRLACLAHGLSMSPDADAADMSLALRAAAMLHHRAMRRLDADRRAHRDGLAVLAALLLETEVEPGKYTPHELVQMCARARARGCA